MTHNSVSVCITSKFLIIEKPQKCYCHAVDKGFPPGGGGGTPIWAI